MKIIAFVKDLICPNQPEGLPFVERKFFCKYFLQNYCRNCGESLAAGKIQCDGCIAKKKCITAL